MKKIFRNLIFIAAIIILLPLISIIYGAPVVMTGILISIIFQDYTSLTTIVSLIIWAWIYTKTEFGNKLGDKQVEIADKILTLVPDN
jgi:hypothetical protein